ncbi:MAG: hypothetical protein QOE41_2588 [Mycobacterium sp.]|nr:hypothetical protein [Mycobacterium sp.]MDT5133277.1 hypothetical protein [Mycobacterium sp.]
MVAAGDGQLCGKPGCGEGCTLSGLRVTFICGGFAGVGLRGGAGGAIRTDAVPEGDGAGDAGGGAEALVDGAVAVVVAVVGVTDGCVVSPGRPDCRDIKSTADTSMAMTATAIAAMASIAEVVRYHRTGSSARESRPWP